MMGRERHAGEHVRLCLFRLRRKSIGDLAAWARGKVGERSAEVYQQDPD
jgi:hypothetical protein